MAHPVDAMHLVRRFVGMLSRAAPPPQDEAWVAARLDAAEQALWAQMLNADRRHSIEVTRRFLVLRPEATPAEVAGALLHDVGKVRSHLGVAGRVVATLVGPRGRRFTAYHDHERLGAEMLREAGAAAETIALVRGDGPAAPHLKQADAI